MKKLLLNYLLIAICLHFLCVDWSVICEEKFYGNDEIVSAQSLGFTPYNSATTMYSYFKNLTTNIGNNETSSSCGYVALAMLLNYYDTFLNDNIVEEKYEVDANFNDDTDKYSVSSPGTNYEANYEPTDDYDVAGYMNYLRTNYVDSSLHAKLALIGTNSLTSNPSNLGTFRETFGTTKTIINNTINNYFDQLPTSISFTISQKTLPNNATNNDYEELNSFIISCINQGKPVLAGMNNGFNGHAVIIYGYNNSKFVYHDGYLNRSEVASMWPTSSTILGTNVSRISYAMSLDFNLEHSCSYHYYNSSNGNSYCYCGQYIHSTHVYTDSYVYYSNNYHKACCHCGEYKLQLHNYRANINVGIDCPCGAENPFI